MATPRGNRAAPCPARSSREQLQERKARSREHEEFIGRVFNGRRTPGSGGLGEPGDVRTDQLLISCKQSVLKSYRLKVADLEKAVREAEGEDLIPAMALRLDGVHLGVERDWILMPLRAVVGLLARKKP